VKDRSGPVGRVTGLAAAIAAAARRRRGEREPRVVLYDSAGHGRVLAEDDPVRASLLEICDELIELAGVEQA
jgi:hypothetical protein